MANLDPDIAKRLKRDPQGLVPAVVQEHGTGVVLMLAWMDDEALHRTLSTGRATYWSRSRQEYWVKGETSGHVQHVRSAAIDCDGDTLLLTVEQTGPACHTGAHTCFHTPLDVSTAADAATTAADAATTAADAATTAADAATTATATATAAARTADVASESLAVTQ